MSSLRSFEADGILEELKSQKIIAELRIRNWGASIVAKINRTVEDFEATAEPPKKRSRTTPHESPTAIKTKTNTTEISSPKFLSKTEPTSQRSPIGALPQKTKPQMKLPITELTRTRMKKAEENKEKEKQDADWEEEGSDSDDPFEDRSSESSEKFDLGLGSDDVCITFDT